MLAGLAHHHGRDYFYTGRDHINGNLDCAGYVMAAYWLMGINLTHVPVWPDDPSQEHRRFPDYELGKNYTSAQRLWDNPRIPHVDEPQPGDLAFWRETYDHPEYITHVMLYAGPNRYVGAQSPRLGEYPNSIKWWTDRLVGYGRPPR